MRVLTRKPGMEAIQPTPAPRPAPQPVPGRSPFEPSGGEGGPVKLPAHTTYIPPRDKGRPRGLRGTWTRMGISLNWRVS